MDSVCTAKTRGVGGLKRLQVGVSAVVWASVLVVLALLLLLSEDAGTARHGKGVQAATRLEPLDPHAAIDQVRSHAHALHQSFLRPEFSFEPPFPFRGYFVIDNWSYGGAAVVTESFVRITPDRQRKSGWLWSKQSCTMLDWEAMFEFRVSGSGTSTYGDGMAFWFTTTPKQKGNVYGARDQWLGLSIIIDTYDNNGNGDGPRLLAIWNNGDIKYDHNRDGQGQEIGSCQLSPSAMRNVDGFTTVMVTMLNGKLRVKYAYAQKDHWVECFSDAHVEPVERQSYYFGFTAATGDIADNHDVRSFAVYDLKAMAHAEGTDATDHDHGDFELKARRAINRRQGRNDDEVTVWSVLWIVFKWIFGAVCLTIAVVLALSGYKVYM
eukprot:CAMPEP_0174245402 /NCGR_PEP_ID=MMETSP0417-20130205/38768_1 /TAXON_ID=242541 /ORGANISM="Mayorella sp, Strain BSH-02190019" /LENGTH=379 /DNA_ID=CAMNT_0015325179 /DNA_START=51 /DNA_END=1187 /DNA_ORIENTATION=-